MKRPKSLSGAIRDQLEKIDWREFNAEVHLKVAPQIEAMRQARNRSRGRSGFSRMLGRAHLPTD